MATTDLPDIYTRARGPLHSSASANISGKSLVPMLQLIYSTSVTHLQVLESAGLLCEFYLYWPLLTLIVVYDIRATTLVLVRIYQENHSCPCYNYFAYGAKIRRPRIFHSNRHGYNNLTRSAHSFVMEHTSSVIINPRQWQF